MVTKEDQGKRIRLLEDTLVDFWGEIVTLFKKHGYDLDGKEINELYEDFKKAMRY